MRRKRVVNGHEVYVDLGPVKPEFDRPRVGTGTGRPLPTPGPPSLPRPRKRQGGGV